MITRFWPSISIPTILALAMSMSLLPGMLSANATIVPSGPFPTSWIGSGPAADTLRLQYYTGLTGDTNEYDALCFAQPTSCVPQIDLTDVQIPTGEVTPSNINDPRFYVTPESPAFDVESVDFNLANSFFGVEFCNGANGITPASTCPDGPGATPIPATCPSTVFRTSTGALDCTKAGIAIRQGIAHLIDKVGYVNNVLQGHGVALDNFLSAAQATLHSGQDFGTYNPAGTTPANIGPYAVDPTLPIGSQQVFPPYLGGTYSHPACFTTAQIQGNGGSCYLSVGGACSWDILLSCTGTFQGQGQVSAFHLTGDGPADARGMVPPGSPDFCAAAQDWVNAGLGNSVSSPAMGCQIIGFTGTGSILIYNRADSIHPLVAALTNSMCQLIHGPSYAPGTCTEVGHLPGGLCCIPPLTTGCKNASEPGTNCVTQGPKRNWNMHIRRVYVGVQVNNLYSFFNSQLASDLCGGNSANEQASNINLVCNSMNDVWSSYGEFAPTPSVAIADTQVANDIFGNHTFVIPVMEHSSQYAWLAGWQGVSNIFGAGIAQGNYYSLLNAYNPNPAVSGPTMRWGQLDSPVSLNPFNATGTVEFNILQSVYDTLLAPNPYSPASLYGWMVNSYQMVNNSNDGNCPVNVQTNNGTWPVAGCVKMALRGDISWHDIYNCSPTDSACIQSHVVTAQDVKFTVNAFNTVGGYFGITQNMADVLYNPSSLPSAAFSAYGGQQSNGQPEILYVALKTVNAWSLLDFATMPVLPQHVWKSAAVTGPCLSPELGGSNVNDVYSGSPACVPDQVRITTGSDPVVNNLLIGSGPWICASGTIGVSGTVIGGGCSSSGNQSPPAGGSITLRRFTYQGSVTSQQGTLNLNYAYFRTNGKFKNFAWADYLAARGSTGTTNGFGAQGTVDIRDIQSVASCLHIPPPYSSPPCDHWSSPAATVSTNSAGPNIGAVNGGKGSSVQVSIGTVVQVSRWYGIQFYDWFGPLGPTPLFYGVNGDQLNPGALPAPGRGQQILYEDGTSETS